MKNSPPMTSMANPHSWSWLYSYIIISAQALLKNLACSNSSSMAKFASTTPTAFSALNLPQHGNLSLSIDVSPSQGETHWDPRRDEKATIRSIFNLLSFKLNSKTQRQMKGWDSSMVKQCIKKYKHTKHTRTVEKKFIHAHYFFIFLPVQTEKHYG